MKHHKRVLPNKLRLLTIPMPSFESATALVMVGAGSRYETKQNNGISHFLEHMFFKGTAKRPTFMEISGLIDGIGGVFNAFTGKEYTGYYIKAGKNNIEVCLDLLADMVQNSKLDEKEIEKEKGVIIEEANMYEDTPMRNIGDIYERLLYGDTPLGWDTVGEKEIIKKVKREDFVNYMDSLYSPSNITVVAAGGIDDAEIYSLTQKHFGKMKDFSTPSALPVIESQKAPAAVIKYKKTEQAHLALGVRTVPLNSPEKYPLSVLAGILGGGMSSRLFSEVREQRGLAYYVSASSDQYTDAGSLVVNAGVDPKRAEESVEVIISELESLKSGKKPITKEELKKAKEYIKGRLVLALEDSQAVSVFYGTQELIEPATLNPDEVLAKIDAVTLEDVNRVAGNYFKSNLLNFAIIGDFKDKAKFEKVLKL